MNKLFDLFDFAERNNYAKPAIVYYMFGVYTVILFTIVAPPFDFLMKLIILIATIGATAILIALSRNKIATFYIDTMNIDSHVAHVYEHLSIDLLFRKLIVNEIPIQQKIISAIKAEIITSDTKDYWISKLLLSTPENDISMWYAKQLGTDMSFAFVVLNTKQPFDIKERIQLPELFGDVDAKVVHADLCYTGEYGVLIGIEKKPETMPVFFGVMSK